ncbi:SOS response-associated peptidase [Asticcacaulis machinosus]|uniref:Abasic site processing protein n=1 Tax=Asticcacaulis machinosus TaxID=2984211 RepID=A0ABT5HH35_9CAUL|nr:SOS response-associated peptidase [Asticcacaulis machinosus]MDC7675561.1 SOS response-associated peptidase [Asticcacaulis machinosus]
MCNLYAMTSNQKAIMALTKAMQSQIGNLPVFEAIFANGFGPIVRNTVRGRELAMARWGMPSPAFALQGKNYDRGITNVRTTTSPHWRKWLGVEHRCLVPFTSFCEPNQADGSKVNTWFAFDDSRPLAFFAGIWVPAWSSVRKVTDGPTTDDLYAFLTTEPNAEVGAVHSKAMPVILTRDDDIEAWMTQPVADALTLQRPLPDAALKIVLTGPKKDDPDAVLMTEALPPQIELF